MTEEEKKAIEHLEKMKKYKNSLCMNWIDAEILLNLIDKQQKEIEELQKYMKTNLIPKSTINLLYISKDKIREIISKYVDIEEQFNYGSIELYGEELTNMIKKLLEE